MDKPIVFGVGMPHTGNDRLADALRARGYKPRVGGDWNDRLASAFLERGEPRIFHDCFWGGHNAWVGWPVVAYQKLVAIYPDAKFIVTHTVPAKWLERWQQRQAELREEPHAPGTAAELFDKHLFGNQPSAGAAENTYARQTDAVIAYLSNRKAEVLTVDMDHRRADRALVKFLGPVPEDETE